MSSTSLTSASTVLSLTSLPQHSRSTTRPCVRAIASIPGADHVLPQFVELGDSFTARHLGRGGQPAILKFRQCQRDRAGGPGYHLAGHWLGCGCGGGGVGRRVGVTVVVAGSAARLAGGIGRAAASLIEVRAFGVVDRKANAQGGY